MNLASPRPRDESAVSSLSLLLYRSTANCLTFWRRGASSASRNHTSPPSLPMSSWIRGSSDSTEALLKFTLRNCGHVSLLHPLGQLVQLCLELRSVHLQGIDAGPDTSHPPPLDLRIPSSCISPTVKVNHESCNKSHPSEGNCRIPSLILAATAWACVGPGSAFFSNPAKLLTPRTRAKPYCCRRSLG